MILITGFEPFDKAESNPSYEAVKMLPEKIKGKTIEKLELPVVFAEAAAGMVRRMNETGYGAALSFSAGSYVCNDTFYRVCNYIKEKEPEIPCGFIHVPNPKGTEKGTDMTVEDFAKALEICVEAVVD